MFFCHQPVEYLAWSYAQLISKIYLLTNHSFSVLSKFTTRSSLELSQIFSLYQLLCLTITQRKQIQFRMSAKLLQTE